MNELLNLFENNFEQMFQPRDLEEVLESSWKIVLKGWWSLDMKKFMYKYFDVKDELTYLTPFNIKGLGREMTYFLLRSRLFEREEEEELDRYASRAIYSRGPMKVYLHLDQRLPSEVIIAEKDKDKFINMFMKWRKNERSSKLI